MHMMSRVYFSLPTTFMPLKAKWNPIQIPGQGAGAVSTLWAPVSFWKNTEHSYRYRNGWCLQ